MWHILVVGAMRRVRRGPGLISLLVPPYLWGQVGRSNWRLKASRDRSRQKNRALAGPAKHVSACQCMPYRLAVRPCTVTWMMRLVLLW